MDAADAVHGAENDDHVQLLRTDVEWHPSGDNNILDTDDDQYLQFLGFLFF